MKQKIYLLVPKDINHEKSKTIANIWTYHLFFSNSYRGYSCNKSQKDRKTKAPVKTPRRRPEQEYETPTDPQSGGGNLNEQYLHPATFNRAYDENPQSAPMYEKVP